MGKPRRLLIADDDPDVLALLVLNFEAEGFEVVSARDGLEAEVMARAMVPDIVVLDVMMPERDGFEVLRNLRANAETRDIPVILLTARATDADIWEGWSTGTDYYITKPFDIDELVRLVRYAASDEGRRQPPGRLGKP
jgi:DNA-binding response OmpR family regulator